MSALVPTLANVTTLHSRPDLYERMGNAVRFITVNRQHQPSLQEMAAVAGLSPEHFQRVFTRYVGVSPKRFLGALTLEAAKQALDECIPILEASLATGLSGPGRLYDLFVTHQAITPGDYKRQGRGLSLHYGFHPTPFGSALILVSERGIVGLAFIDVEADRSAAPSPAALEGRDGWGWEAALNDMKARFPEARCIEDSGKTAPFAERLFDGTAQAQSGPLPLAVSGTNFQVKVWEALMRIPPGAIVTYGALATAIGVPGSVRAVANAVGRNPISYFIPCHRVLRSNGSLGGYHWGLTTKRALLAWERGTQAP